MSDSDHTTVTHNAPHRVNLTAAEPIEAGQMVYADADGNAMAAAWKELEDYIRYNRVNSHPAFKSTPTVACSPAVVALISALVDPQNNAQRLAVAVLMGDVSALRPLVDAVQDELLS
jgi:CTP synthase (UTP-ammonia lyase)